MNPKPPSFAAAGGERESWRTFAGLIERNAAHYPGVGAVVCESRRLTYREYASRCRRLANAFAGLGVRKHDRVAMLSMNSLEYCEYYGACELAGYIAAPINYRLAVPEIRDTLANVGACVCLYEEPFGRQVGAAASGLDRRPRLVRVAQGHAPPPPAGCYDYERLIEAAADEPPAGGPSPGDVAYLMSTSGTTGKPKAVIRTHRVSTLLAELLAADYRTPLGGATLVMTPLYHVGGKDMRASQVWRAGTVVVLQHFDVAKVLRAIAAERINTMFLVATQLQALLDAPDFTDHDLSSLQTVCLAGAPCSAPLLARAIDALGPIFCVQYGMTEGMVCTLHSHEFGPNGSADMQRRISSVGHSIAQGEIRVVCEDGSIAPPFRTGEVCTRSEVMFEGYWRDEEASDATLREGWFLTGDLGFVDEQGYLFLVDRKKDMIVSGGENVYCREVETALLRDPTIVDAAVVGVADARWGEAVVAYVIAAPGSTLDAGALIEHCRHIIAGYKCPRQVIALPAFPLTPNGKIDKVALRAMHRGAGVER